MLLLWFTVFRILGSSEHSSEKGLHRRSYLGWGRVQVDTQGSGACVVQARGLVSLLSGDCCSPSGFLSLACSCPKHPVSASYVIGVNGMCLYAYVSAFLRMMLGTIWLGL